MKRFELILPTNSYQFRQRQNVHQALHLAGANAAEGYRICVDLDLEQFFAKFNYDRLMWQLSCRIGGSRRLHLIRQMLKVRIDDRRDGKSANQWDPSG